MLWNEDGHEGVGSRTKARLCGQMRGERRVHTRLIISS